MTVEEILASPKSNIKPDSEVEAILIVAIQKKDNNKDSVVCVFENKDKIREDFDKISESAVKVLTKAYEQIREIEKIKEETKNESNGNDICG